MKRQGSNQRLLYLLKTRGDQTATALAEILDMTMMGARKLLLALEADELVSSYYKNAGRGRPKLFWTLSDKGQARFPDRHADITLSLIENIKSLTGEQGLDQIIAKRETTMLTAYLKATKGDKSLKQKLTSLVEIRSREGYMAALEQTESGQLLLVENHCPICVAATACQGFCRSELEIFRQVLATKVERHDYILEGARRCSYKIG